MSPLICVYLAALATVIGGLIYVAAERAWARVCTRRWDRGVDL